MAKKKEVEVTTAQEVTPVVEIKKVPASSIATKVKKPVKWFVQEAIDKRKEKE
jgi:hypothetical protein